MLLEDISTKPMRKRSIEVYIADDELDTVRRRAKSHGELKVSRYYAEAVLIGSAIMEERSRSLESGATV